MYTKTCKMFDNNMKNIKKILYFLFIILISVSCAKTAPTIDIADLLSGVAPASTGYSYPSIVDVYPQNGTTVPLSTRVLTIVFSLPIYPASLTGNIVPTSVKGLPTYSTTMTASNIVTITFDTNLSDSDTITLNITNGVLDNIQDPKQPISNPGAYIYYTSAAVDSTSPTGNTPGPTGTGVALNSAISLTFNELYNVNTLTGSTFYVESSSILVEGTITYTLVSPFTVTFTPSTNLEPNTTYTVHATTGIKDISGNSYAGTTWTFTTGDASSLEVPAITFGPWYDPALQTLFWSTNVATNHTLYLGRNNSTPPSSVLNGVSDNNYVVSHSYDLASLTADKRYYYQVNFDDIVPGSAQSSGVLQFNTETDEAIPGADGEYIDFGPGNQEGTHLLERKPKNGIFTFYRSQTGYIESQLFDTSLNILWVYGGLQFFPTATYTFSSAVEDEIGGVIVKALNGSNSSYIKRALPAGTLDWGYSNNDTGLPVKAGAVNVSAVPVYADMMNNIASGTTEMDIRPTYPLFKDSNTIIWGAINPSFSAIAVNDIVIITTSQPYQYRTVTQKPNFNYMIGLDAAITAGGSYVVARGGTSTSFTASNHGVYTTTAGGWTGTLVNNYNSGTNTIYTEHNYTAPTGPAWLNIGDIIAGGTSYGLVLNTPAQINITGTERSSILGSHAVDVSDYYISWPYAPYIRDFQADFISKGVAAGDLIFDTNNSSYNFVAYVAYETELQMYTTQIFTVNDIYRISTGQYCQTHIASTYLDPFYRITADYNVNIASPTAVTIYDSYNTANDTTKLTAVAYPAANPLYDNDSDFVTSAVAGNDIVFNTTDNTFTYVNGAYTPRIHALQLASDIFANGENYSIKRFNVLNTNNTNITDIGFATSTNAHLMNSAAAWPTGSNGTVSVGDIVLNVTTGNYAMITNITANDLTLKGQATFTLNDCYAIIHQRGLLLVWQQTGTGPEVWGRIVSLTSGSSAPAVLKNEFQIAANAQNPVAISDNNGNAWVVYEDTSTGKVRAVLVNAAGIPSANVVMNVTNVSNSETIKKVISDGQKGVTVLYSYNSNLYIQRIDHDYNANLTREWPATGGEGYTVTPSAIAYTYDHDIVMNGTTNAIIAFRDGTLGADNIWVRQVGATTWASGNIYNPNAAGVQKNPKIFFDGTNDPIIIWEDNRFVWDMGFYGIFGMKLDLTTGAEDPTWIANSGGTADYDGVAIIFNRYSKYWPEIQLVPYDTGTSIEAFVSFDDRRTFGGTDIETVYFKTLRTFVP